MRDRSRRLTLVSTALIALAALVAGAAQARALATPPSMATAPALAGSAQVGATLTGTTGSWSGDSPISYTFSWLRCNAVGNACVPVAGAANQSYLLVPADAGATLRVSVVAVNAAGAGGAVSAPSATIVTAPSAPTSSVAPTITGAAREGQSLLAGAGTWSGSGTITYTYQWKRCDASGQACTDASNVIAQNAITLAAADVGTTIRVVVIATTSAGSASATSAPSPVVVAINAPTLVTLPTVTGVPRETEALMAGPGTWSGSGIAYKYQWRRCDPAGENCVDASAPVTLSTVTLVAADVGKTMRVIVSATSSGGTATATSEPSAVVVKKDAPVNTAAPTISGTAREGATLTVSTGTWNGAGTIAYTYQWRRCDAAGANCVDASSVIAQNTITLTAADVGKTVRAVVIATNTIGPASTTTPASAPIVAKDAPAPSTPSTPTPALPDGTGPLKVAQVLSPNRLTMPTATAQPSRIRSRGAFLLQVRVTDAKGRPVGGAVVKALPVPTPWATSGTSTTDSLGLAAVVVRPTKKLPLTKGTLPVFLQVTKPKDDPLASVGSARLVLVPIG